MVMKPDLPFEMYRNTLRYVPTKQENWSNPRKFVPTNFKDSIVIKNQTIFICAFNFDYLKIIIDIFSTYFTLTFILLLQSLRTCSNIFFILLTFLWLYPLNICINISQNFTPRPIILNFEYFYNWSNSYLFSGTLFYQIADFIWFLNQNLSSKSLNKGSGIIAFCIYLQCLYTGSNILRYNCKTRLSKRGYSDKEIDNL